MGEIISFYEKRKKEMLSINQVASFFIKKEPQISNKKLQKLCYYAQSWYFALNKQKLIDCKFEAWIHGPVCPELYFSYKTGNIRPEDIEEAKYTQFMETVYKAYGRFSGDKLESFTHSESPWINARRGLADWEYSTQKISEDDMLEYYSGLIK